MTLLYRPCGLEEMLLVLQLEARAWPPRLPEQPIFYPVTNQAYAAQISREWNTREGSNLGYVTQFEVDATYLEQFDRQVVGASMHEELWVPSERLDDFNQHITSCISIVELYAAPLATGYTPKLGSWQGLGAKSQWESLVVASESERLDLLSHNKETVLLNLPLWRSYGAQDDALDAVERLIRSTFDQVQVSTCTASFVA